MYTPLYVKTDYSLLSSLVKIDALILKLKKMGYTACCLCDDHLYGTMEWMHQCEKNGITPMVGLEIRVFEDRLLLYAQNEIGYHSLVEIECIKNKRTLTLDDLACFSQELIAIGFLNNSHLSEYQHIYSEFYIGVSHLDEEHQALALGYLPVYVEPVLYLEKYEYKYLPYVFMIRDGKTIADGISFLYPDHYLKSEEEVLVSKEALERTNEIASKCNISFTKQLFMPKYDVSNAKDFLVSLAHKGLERRLNYQVPKVYLDRLHYELDIILKMNFADYFLVVYDYIKFAKKEGILVGPGRGSAAGSLVSYALGITEVDPVHYHLLFERFLNPERVTMPDIDTDFPDVERDRVIDYVIKKYGSSNVAGIVTFGTLGAKQAIRDVGRVLKIDTKKIDYISKFFGNKDSFRDILNQKVELQRFLESDDKLKLFALLVEKIENNKRHTSIHAAGIVISREPLHKILPVTPNEKMLITEYTMEYLEELGLIKMDFLGIRNLSIIKNILEDIKEKEGVFLDFNQIPLDDEKVMEIFSSARTTGIFQFESAGMRRFLQMLKPKTFFDICDAIALFRPGPALNIPSYIQRREGKEKIDYLDPSLEAILKSTYGIIIYQEQIMQIANVMADYSFGEADILRRAMSKKKKEVLVKEEEKFIRQAVKKGYSEEISKKVYDLILRFADYGFNKSHSVSYSLVAYKMAYLKYYYPSYFYANLLQSVVGSEVKTLEYLTEVKMLGLSILPPDVNHSFASKYRVMDHGLCIPLAAIRNVGSVISKSIVLEREKGPFTDIFDFLRRTYTKTNNIKVLESLCYAHAFACFGYNIATLITNMDLILNYLDISFDLDPDLLPKPEIVYHEEYDSDFLLEKEKELFGYYLTSHKSEKYKQLRKNIVDLKDIPQHLNRYVSIVVCIDRKKELQTKKKDTMAFFTGSDNTGSLSIVVFPKKYLEVIDKKVDKGDVLMITGRVERRFDEYQIILEEMEVLNR